MKNVLSVCPKCNKKINAKIVIEKNKVFMIKECSVHGKFKTLVESDKKFYAAAQNKNNKNLRHSRLEIPVTTVCNLRCSFCYASDKRNDMDISEISKIIDQFDGDYVSISGGEPTLRNDLPKIIRLVIKKNKIPVLNTNGIKLANKEYVKKLKKSGLRLVHFSFNGFHNDPFIKDGSENVSRLKQKALKNLIKNNFSIILSILLLKGKNESQLEPIIKYALKNSNSIFELRIRSANMIGRYKKIDVYSTSELLDLLCKIIKVNKNSLIEEMSKISKGKCTCKFSGTFFFKGNSIKPFKIDVYSRTGSLNIFSFVGKYGKSLTIDLFKFFNIDKIINSYKLIKLLNFSVKKSIQNLFFGKKNRSLRIEIRSWPNKYNVNLNEISNCPSLGLSKDNKNMLPFCYRFFTDKMINREEISKCKY